MDDREGQEVRDPEAKRPGGNTVTNYNSVNLTDTVGVFVLGAVAVVLAVALLLAVRRWRQE